jgi:hypothetical protein
VLHEDLASDPRSAAFEVRFQLLHMDVDPDELVRHYASDFLRTASLASQNLHQWLSEPTEELAPYVSNEEIQRFAEGLRNIVESALASEHEIVHNLEDMLDQQVAMYLEEQKQFQRWMDASICGLDAANGNRLQKVIELSRFGYGEVGVERNEALREAKATAHEIITDSNGSNCGPACLEYAFLSWKMGRNGLDSERYASLATTLMSRGGGLGAHMAARLLALVHYANDDYRKAHDAISRSVAYSPSTDAIREAAVLSARIGRMSEATQFIEQGAPTSVLFPVSLLAEADLAQAAPEVLRCVVRAQAQARNDAGRSLSFWNQQVHRVRQAQKRAEMIVNLPGNIDTGRKEMAARLPEADLLTACLMAQAAQRCTNEVRRFSTFELGREQEKRQAAYRSAKQGIDLAWQAREAVVHDATAPQKIAVELARQALNRSHAEGEKVQNGCGMSAGIGCGTFVLYLGLAAVLATQGIAGGPGTLLGTFGLIASAIPILFGISALIGAGMRRSALEADLREKMRTEQLAREAAETSADKAYKEHVAQLREMLHDAEVKLLRIDEAIAMLDELPEAA